MTSASPSTQLIHPAVLHATLQARADELAARKAERQEARSHRARSRGGRGFIAILSAVSLLLVGGLSVLAVHDAGVFELDGNAVAEGAVPGDDWDLLEDGFGDPNDDDSALVSEFVVDPFEGGVSPDFDDVFAQNSKDTLDIPDWSWKKAEPEDKNDITNAYAAAYFATDGPDAGDLILYFGVDRMANNGDAAVGVWFLQSGVEQTDICQGPNCEFSGAHVAGDILVQSDFTTGGTVERLDVYMWDCDGFFGSQALCEAEFNTTDFTVVNAGGDLWRIFEGVDCDDATAGDLACASVNNTVVDAPWDYSYKCVGSNQPDECDGLTGVNSLDVFPISTFFEGGVNLTDTLGEDICLATFIAETRSSQSETSTLDDKALGGFDLCGTKSGTKYEDPDGDGDLTDGVPLDGWTINLYSDDGDTVGELDVNDTLLDTAVTGDGDWADGYYEFPDLFPGDYIVCEVLQTDWFQSAPNPGTADCSFDPTLGVAGYAFTIEQGVDETGNDFGNFEQGSKSGTKFNDLNGDGVWDEGEPGLEGWTINVYADDGDGILQAGEYAVVAGTDDTDSDGDYEITGLDPGDYIACEVLETGWAQSFPDPGTADCTTESGATDLAPEGYAFTVTSGSSEEDNDFGNFEQGSKSGTKFNDLNGDGVWDEGEPGLEGWTINVYADDGDGILQAAEYAVVAGTDDTDVNGDYEITGLDPGDYIACEVLETDWTQSFPDPGTADCTTESGATDLAPEGYAFTVTSGSSEEDNDFGNFEQGSKSGTKFEDENADGDQDTEDLGLEGWTINVYADTDGDGDLSATEYAAGTAGTDDTDSDGEYEITGLDPGDYIACEVLQTDWFQSAPSSGADCTTASGATDLAQWGFAFTVTSGSSEEDNDFGNFQQGSKSGTKLSDPNGDGDLTDGIGLENWVINVYADTDGDGDLSAAEYAAGTAGTDTTDVNGDYEITGLDPGDYIACEVLQAGWTQSFPSSGADCTTASGATDLAQWGFAFTVTSGSSEEDNDFGNFQPLQEGCTPGFWKTHTDLWDDVGSPDLSPTYDPDDDFYAVFGITVQDGGALPDTLTLEQALNLQGGGIFALARHAAAAILNADSSIDYPYTTDEVIDIFRDGINSSTLIAPDTYTLNEALAALSTANELGCPFGANTAAVPSTLSLAGFDLVSAFLFGGVVAGSRYLGRRGSPVR